MALLFNSVLLIAGLVTTGIGLATLSSNSSNWLIVAVGAGISGVAWHLDRLRVRSRDEAVAKEITDRVAALTRRPWLPHERLEIPPNNWLFVLTVGMTLTGGWLVQQGFSTPSIKWPPVLAGAAILAIGALLLPTVLAGVGKPALVLDRKGVTTPVDGSISWSAVEGVYLQVVENRGMKSYALIFSVPTYAKVVTSIHWSQRWLALLGLGALRRRQIGVPLWATKERPQTIEAVARHLWNSATGREHFWSPNASTASNESFRQLAALRSEMAPPTNFERELKDRPASAITQLEANMKRLEQARQLVASINNEQKKSNRKANLGIALALGGVLVALTWPWVKQHFGF